jgi:excinuclease ABC subunit C
VFGFARQAAAVTIAILFIRSGLLNGTRTFLLNDPYGDDRSILAQALAQFYHIDALPPGEILLPFAPEDLDLIQEHFDDKSQKKTVLKVPMRGDNHKLVTMANTNARQLFEEKEKKEKSWNSLCAALEKRLHLSRAPERIECLDISNIGGKQAVGSLVHFLKGEPDKKKFRHFRIKTVEGPDDYAMMREVLMRRLSRGIKEETLPDLFIVDGGRGQLGMALAVASELGITEELDWIGIAKEKQDEGEKLYKPGRKNPLLLRSHDPVLLYLMRIRDESHRYGITFHRKLRRKATLSSELDKIPGIGKAKKKNLLRHMGSLKRVKAATMEELMAVNGIGRELAEKIFFHFNR